MRHVLKKTFVVLPNFNPRTHVGCDQFRPVGWCGSLAFQSTHPRGVRPAAVIYMSNSFAFQSTHPRGVRLDSTSETLGDTDFNPRTHVGCDAAIFNHKDQTQISIHAPTWGATSDDKRQECGQDISIHAPTWGATILNLFLLFRQKYFNPRTHVGCDSGRG